MASALVDFTLGLFCKNENLLLASFEVDSGVGSMVVTNHRWFRCFENIDVIDVSLDVSAPLPYPVPVAKPYHVYVEKAVNVQVPVHVDRPYPVYVKVPVVKHAPSIAVSSYPISGIGHSAIGHDASVYADHHGYHK